MKKVLFIATLTVGLVSFGNLNAQKLNIGANLSTGLPMGDFGDAVDFGIGGGLSIDYYFNDQWSIGLEGEYLGFAYSDEAIDETVSIIPIQLVGAYHIDIEDILDFYAGTGVGLFMLDNAIMDPSSEFGISPRIGIAYELTPELFLDLNVRYALLFNGESEEFGGITVETENTSYIGFNLGLLYTLGEY